MGEAIRFQFEHKKYATGIFVGISPPLKDDVDFPEEELFTAIIIDMNQHKQYRFNFYRHKLASVHNKVHKKNQVHQV